VSLLSVASVVACVSVVVFASRPEVPTLGGTQGQVRVLRSGDDRLSGITAVDVLVDVAAADGQQCIVDRARAAGRAVVALRAARIEATVSDKAPSWFYSVLVDIHTTLVGASCVAAVSTELVAHVQGAPEADKLASPDRWGSLLIGPMSLLRENTLVTARPEEHDATVQKTVEAHVTTIATKIRAVNP
jgi:hypothetical protein